MGHTSLIKPDQSIDCNYSFPGKRRSIIGRIIEFKKCPLCSEYIDVVEFSEHLLESLGPADVSSSLVSPSVQESTVGKTFDDDNGKHTGHCIEQENSLVDSLLPPIEEPVADDKLRNDCTEHLDDDTKLENTPALPLLSATQEPVVNDELHDDHIKHKNSDTRPENTSPELLPLSTSPTLDLDETDDDYLDSLPEWNNTLSDALFQPIKHADDEFDTPPSTPIPVRLLSLYFIST